MKVLIIVLIILISKNQFYAYDCTDKANTLSLYAAATVTYD